MQTGKRTFSCIAANCKDTMYKSSVMRNPALVINAQTSIADERTCTYISCIREDFLSTKYLTIYQPVTVSVSPIDNSAWIHMYRRFEFYFETSPLKRRLYFSVWCSNLSRVRQEMSKVGKDQEKAQSEKYSHSKNRGGEKNKLTIRYL